MSPKLKAVGVGLACLACCLPLIFAVVGITAGAAGAIGYWMGRNEALIVAGIGLIYLLTILVSHLRTQFETRPVSPKREETHR